MEMLTAFQRQWEAAVMSVTENEMKQPAKAATTKIWIEVNKGEIEVFFSAKASRFQHLFLLIAIIYLGKWYQ